MRDRRRVLRESRARCAPPRADNLQQKRWLSCNPEVARWLPFSVHSCGYLTIASRLQDARSGMAATITPYQSHCLLIRHECPSAQDGSGGLISGFVYVEQTTLDKPLAVLLHCRARARDGESSRLSERNPTADHATVKQEESSFGASVIFATTLQLTVCLRRRWLQSYRSFPNFRLGYHQAQKSSTS